MQPIKPIETRYKGYRFRSRLEARWAVFFDALNISWQYECEGWKIKTGAGIRYYLPDFYLPDLGIWYEVKGKATGDDHSLMSHFRFDVGPIALSDGTPGSETVFVYDRMLVDRRDMCSYEGEAVWGKLSYLPNEYNYTSLVIFGGDAFILEPSSQHGKWFFETNKNNVDRSQIDMAYIKARSARFEHGESG